MAQTANDLLDNNTVASKGVFGGLGAEFEKALTETLHELVRDHRKVIVIGRIPRLRTFDRQCSLKAVKMPFIDCMVR